MVCLGDLIYNITVIVLLFYAINGIIEKKKIGQDCILALSHLINKNMKN
jgi:hypothetical protein